MHRSAVSLAAALILFALPTSADPPDREPTPAESPSTAEESSADALRVWVDPETGELTSEPTAAQREAFERTLRRDLRERDLLRPPPRFFPLSGGGTGVYQEGGFLGSLVVLPGADGTLHFACEDHGHLLGENAEGRVDEPSADEAAPSGAPLR